VPLRLLASFLLLSSLLQASIQPSFDTSAPQWIRKAYTDSFSGIPLVSFTLTGRFLDPSQHGHLAAPVWTTVCQPKPTHNGKNLYEGLLAKSYVDFGTVLNSTSAGLPVIYRLDDGKPKAELWSSATAGTAAFLDRFPLNTVLYGHYLPHRANSNPPTKKLVLKVDEAYAASIVAEFDIPDPDEMARICGTTYHKE
jgi:hypothetical protein